MSSGAHRRTVVNYLHSPLLNHVSHSCRSYGPIFTPTLQTSTASWLSGRGWWSEGWPGGQDLSIGTGSKIVFSVVSNYERWCPASLILSYQHWAGVEHRNRPDLCAAARRPLSSKACMDVLGKTNAERTTPRSCTHTNRCAEKNTHTMECGHTLQRQWLCEPAARLMHWLASTPLASVTGRRSRTTSCFPRLH